MDLHKTQLMVSVLIAANRSI